MLCSLGDDLFLEPLVRIIAAPFQDCRGQPFQLLEQGDLCLRRADDFQRFKNNLMKTESLQDREAKESIEVLPSPSPIDRGPSWPQTTGAR